MGLRSRIKEDIDDFRRGFNESADEPPPAWATDPALISRVIGGALRMVLLGFLLAFEGVPFLPWGLGWEFAATAAAGVLGSLHFRRGSERAQLARAAGVLLLVFAVLRLGEQPSTSVVLIGAFIAALAALATSYPFLYGVVFGAAVMAVATQVFDLRLFKGPEMMLSGTPFDPDQAGRQALHMAGLLLLTGLITFGRTEMERFRTKAEEAVAARDQAVSDERARIARELHDVVSHHVTAMTLQAEAAAMTGDKAALASVASAGREALTELRRMLGVLRHPSGDGDADSLDPQPGLGQLDALAARANSGPAVRVERRGAVRPLSAGLELGAYRLVQEAITNSAKHSDATTVDVVLTYGDGSLTIEVVDNGRPLEAARVGSGGLGLIGMQERVALLNGELAAGPRDDAQGYRVLARVPFDA